MYRRREFALQLAGLAAAAHLLPARAEEAYPARPVKLVIGFAPGGGADAVARLISTALGEELRTSIVVENRPGANANIATDVVARSPKDGYTLLYNTSAIAISPHLYKKLSYDAKRDLAPVALTAAIPLVLVATPEVPARSIGEFVAYLKANAGRVEYASSSPGNLTHLAAAEFLHATGTTAHHVPYKSEAPALTDLLAGRVKFYFGNANTLIPQIKAKKLLALAVTSQQRVPQLPDVPTLSESVAPGLEMVAWSGFMAPRGTPAAVVDRLAAALEKVIGSGSLAQKISDSGAQARFAGPTAYGRLIDAETARWGRVVKEAGVEQE